MMKDNLSKYFSDIQINEEYSEIDIYEKLQSIYKTLCCGSFIRDSHDTIDSPNTSYAIFLKGILDFFELAESIFISAKYNPSRHKKFHNFTESFNSFIHDFKSYVNTNPQFRLGIVFDVFNAIEYVGVISLFVTKSNSTYLCLYKEGCSHLNVGIRSLFSFAKSSISIAQTVITKDCSVSLMKDVSYLIKMAKFNQINQQPFPSSVDRNLFRKMALLANGGYMGNTTKVRDYLSTNNIQGIYSSCNLGRFTNDGSFNFLSVYGHLLEDDNNSVFLIFGGTFIKTLNLKTFATIITDFVQLKHTSCSYIVSLGLVAKLVENYKNKQVFVCGHSLGGGYTQFASARFPNVKGYTFNSAGLSCESVRLLKTSNCANLTHLRMSKDMVSCVGTLIEGDIYYLPSQKAYWHILDNHSVESIIKSL